MAKARFDPLTVGEGVGLNKQAVGINTGIEIDFGAFFPIMKQFPKITQSVMPGTLNRTGLAGTTAGSRALRKVYNIKQKRINQAMTKIKARRNSFLYQLTVRSRGIGLINFGARQTKKGESYAIFKGKRNTIAHAFEAPMLGIKTEAGDKRKGVFIRKSTSSPPRKGKYKGRHIIRGPKAGQLLERQELQRYVGPGPSSMWGKRFVQAAFAARVTEFLPIEYNRRMERALNAIIAKHKVKR